MYERLSESNLPSTRAIVRIALPFSLYFGLQSILNLSDTWFVGSISSDAVAALSIGGWLTLLSTLLLGATALGVQAIVAQCVGARRHRRAAHTVWLGLWGCVVSIPICLAVANCGGALAVMPLTPKIAALVGDYWFPRMCGAPLAMVLTVFAGFFCGIGEARVWLGISVLVVFVNAAACFVLIRILHFGIAGAAVGTVLAQGVGTIIALLIFLRGRSRQSFGSHLTWRPNARRLFALSRLGSGVAVQQTTELAGFALFQIVAVLLGTVEGAATQIVLALTSICYLPASGLAQAATTEVGTLVGAGRFESATAVGNKIIGMTVAYMFFCGLVLAIFGGPLASLFTPPSDSSHDQVVALCGQLLWLAVGYQIFDGLSIASAGCLRGATDVRTPAILVAGTTFGLFVPLTLLFAPHPLQLGIAWLPGFGMGSLGAWTGALIYLGVLGSLLYSRWSSRAWLRSHTGTRPEALQLAQ